MSPVRAESRQLLESPRRRLRNVCKTPYRVLDAPELADDFYLNLVDWSSTNVLGVGLGSSVYLWAADTAAVSKLCDLSSTNDTVSSVSWVQKVILPIIGLSLLIFVRGQHSQSEPSPDAYTSTTRTLFRPYAHTTRPTHNVSALSLGTRTSSAPDPEIAWSTTAMFGIRQSNRSNAVLAIGRKCAVCDGVMTTAQTLPYLLAAEMTTKFVSGICGGRRKGDCQAQGQAPARSCQRTMVKFRFGNFTNTRLPSRLSLGTPTSKAFWLQVEVPRINTLDSGTSAAERC